ncbi:LuxR C-terminal-related transcriptional regulator [Pseudonocardia parietis]|nr:LuxR C-terminal-related transcriptional regulator [Pseudonocardia parietis]
MRDRLAAADAIAPLSDRQREVLAALGHGASNHDIARQLHLTEGTVKQYVSGLMRDLGVTNRVRAALLAYQAGLTDIAHDNRDI